MDAEAEARSSTSPVAAAGAAGLLGGSVFFGCTGALAAISVPTYVMHLRDTLGVSVTIGMTRMAERFIPATTMRTVAQRVITNDGECDGRLWSPGEIASDVDAVVILPASADFVAQMANGFCPSIVAGVALHFEPPCLVVPSIPGTLEARSPYRRNLAQIEADGHVIPPTRPGPVLRLSDDSVTKQASILPPAGVTHHVRQLIIERRNRAVDDDHV
ncbi:flavoprotein [Pimelobacter simplex]|uniref:flavoprotein n=1 Tax=Nocardioides simplex TaxID=2045 RepID=UPI00137639C6|nr:flavoprotein [Pimelobacter simplex]